MRRAQGGINLGGGVTLTGAVPILICGGPHSINRTLFVNVANKVGGAACLPDSFDLIYERPGCMLSGQWTTCDDGGACADREWGFTFFCGSPITFGFYNVETGFSSGNIEPASYAPFIWEVIAMPIDIFGGTADFFIFDVP